MLWYRKSWLGGAILCRCIGSTLPEVVLPATISALIAVVVEVFAPPGLAESVFIHPYPFQVYSYIVAFALVFRTNVANSRYWEARSQVGAMGSRWGDSVSLALSFEEAAIRQRRAAAAAAAAAEACGEGKGEGKDEGKEEGKEEARKAAVAGVAEVYGRDVRRAQAELLHLYSLMHAVALQYLRRDNELRNLCDESESALDGTVFLDGTEEEAREVRVGDARPSGGGCLHRMWRVGRSDEDMRRMHERRCRELPLPVLGGVSEETLSALETCDERVGYVFSMLLTLINARRLSGNMLADPPLFARIQQALSDGMLGFAQARKIEDTPFPFPYAQILSFMLYAFAFTFPLLAAAKVGDSGLTKMVSPLLTFLVVLCYFGLHEVARILEDPFLFPPNDLPTVGLQMDFNSRLLAAWEGCHFPTRMCDSSPAERLLSLRYDCELAHRTHTSVASRWHRPAPPPAGAPRQSGVWSRSRAVPNKFWNNSSMHLRRAPATSTRLRLTPHRHSHKHCHHTSTTSSTRLRLILPQALPPHLHHLLHTPPPHTRASEHYYTPHLHSHKHCHHTSTTSSTRLRLILVRVQHYYTPHRHSHKHYHHTSTTSSTRLGLILVRV
ncbi:hypothetical protein AB1Y20_010927 [Prymnesium parvum]|uniref:Bestrophin homolog n=1 Tax=Prymnesium parvum TaxID=97485 RepID=A0AB34IR39_PRYPA